MALDATTCGRTGAARGNRPALALKVYAQAMRRSEDEQAQLAALMDGEKARQGIRADVVAIEQAKGRAA